MAALLQRKEAVWEFLISQIGAMSVWKSSCLVDCPPEDLNRTFSESEIGWSWSPALSVAIFLETDVGGAMLPTVS